LPIISPCAAAARLSAREARGGAAPPKMLVASAKGARCVSFWVVCVCVCVCAGVGMSAYALSARSLYTPVWSGWTGVERGWAAGRERARSSARGACVAAGKKKRCLLFHAHALVIGPRVD